MYAVCGKEFKEQRTCFYFRISLFFCISVVSPVRLVRLVERMASETGLVAEAGGTHFKLFAGKYVPATLYFSSRRILPILSPLSLFSALSVLHFTL